MADYSALRDTINNNIVPNNGRQEITGAKLNSVLNSMVDVLGEGYTFLGIATISTSPATPAGKAYYLAGAAGTYTNFGNIVVASDEVALLVWDGTAWSKVVTGAASKEEVQKLSGFDVKVSLTQIPYHFETGHTYLIINNEAFQVNVYGRVTENGENVNIKTPIGANATYLYSPSSDLCYVRIAGAQAVTNGITIYDKTIFDTLLANDALSKSVLYGSTQALTDAQKSIARNNIGVPAISEIDALKLFDITNGVINLKVLTNANIISQLTDAGDYGYLQSTNTLYYNNGSSVVQIPLSHRSIYKYNGTYYRYNGTGLEKDLELDSSWYVIDGILLEQGGIDIAGNLVASATRVRTSVFLSGKVKIIAPEGFIVFHVNYYDATTHAPVSYVAPNSQIYEIGVDGCVAKVIFARGNTAQSLTPADLKYNPTIEYLNNKIDSLSENNNIINLAVMKGAGITTSLNAGEYGYNTVTHILYYKTESGYNEVPLKGNILYVYKGMYYHKVDSKLVLDSELNGGSAYPLVKFDYGSFDFDDFASELVGVDFDARNSGNQWRTIYDQISAKFDALVSDYPNYVTKVDAAAEESLSYPAYANLNGSASGDYLATPTYKTYMYKFIEPENSSWPAYPSWHKKDVILLFGAVHGNELASPFNLYLLAKKLCEAADPNMAKLRGAFDIYIVPLVNGYGVYHADAPYSQGVTMGRINANGVNLNRNFPITAWVEGGQGTINYTGPSAGSEFETQLVMALVNDIKPLVAVDCHNYGQNSAYQFYNEVYDKKFIPKDYQAYIDCCIAFTKNLPTYFGSFKKIQANGSPYRVFEFDEGKASAWVSEKTSSYSETIEISDCINYLNGVINTGANTTQFSNDVFKVGQFTLTRILLRFIEWSQRETILQ